jgi:hypothetical protein
MGNLMAGHRIRKRNPFRMRFPKLLSGLHLDIFPKQDPKNNHDEQGKSSWYQPEHLPLFRA